MPEGSSTLPIIVVALIALGVIVVAFAASRYKVAKPNEALVIAGKKGAPGGIKVVVGGGAIIYPLINVAKRLSLEVRSISVRLDGAVTTQGVPVSVEGIVNVKIADDEDALRQAAQRFLDSQDRIADIVRNVMEGSLRTIIGQLTVEQLIRDREVFAARVQDVANSDLTGTGLSIDVFTIQSIDDSEGYIVNLGRKAAAEVKRSAEIAEAESEREAREKQETARQLIIEAEKVTALKQQAVRKEVAAEEARADQAGPLAEAEATREVVVTQTEVAELTAKRRDKELDSEIRRQSDAQRYATEQDAEARKYAAVADADARAQARRVQAGADADAVRFEAEASKDRRLLEAEAERANLEAIAAGTAYEERETGNAKADAVRAVGDAEASAMRQKADAYKEYENAAVLELLVSRLPEVARAIAEPIGKVDKITIIDTEGASKLTKTTTTTIEQLDAVLNSFTGRSLSDLVGRFLANGGSDGDVGGDATDPQPPDGGTE